MATVTVTPQQDAVTGEIFIAAPPERVFQALTDPKQAPLWWGQQGMYRITEWKGDVRPGGKWFSVGVGDDGTSFRVDGEYLEVDSPRLVVHTWIASWSGPLKTVVRWELEPRSVHGLQHRGPQKVGTGTVVKIRQEGFDGAPEAARNHAQGWARVLGWMQAFVENGETVDTRK
jgi:uncharacterized protein YndB with AHSA1/START domain